MRLQQQHPDPLGDQARLRDLEFLLEQPSLKELRPCEGCDVPCPCSASLTCTCACAPNCSHSSAKMSSEAGRYPIEEKIKHLVFQFNCLRLCQPYWSCEGHLASDGSIFRIPQVWFYTRSLVYPRLIGDLLTQLQFEKKIVNPWHVCVSFSGDSLDTGFSIEPDMKVISNPSLPQFQADALAISESLVSGMRKLAGEYIVRYSKN